MRPISFFITFAPAIHHHNLTHPECEKAIARFDELRTRYEVEKHIAEKERNFHYFLFAVDLSVVLVLLLAGVFYYNRQMATKNRKLYERIKEQNRLADELFRMAQTQESAAATDAAPEDAAAETTADDASVAEDSSSADTTALIPVAPKEQYLLVARFGDGGCFWGGIKYTSPLQL